MKSVNILLIIVLFITFVSCASTKKPIEGFYKYSCVLMDDIEIFSNNRYRYYTQGVLNEGTWELNGDTLTLLNDWQKENLLKKDKLLFDKSDTLLLGKSIFNQLNGMFIESLKPEKFIRKNDKFYYLDNNKVIKSCFMKKVKKMKHSKLK